MVVTYNYKIIFVGCGNMGKPILQSLLKSSLNIEIYVIEPNYQQLGITSNKQVKFISNLTDLPKDFKANIILFAVKPQIIAKIIAEYQALINDEIIIMSILAGIKASYFTKIFNNDTQIVRIMPNLGAKYAKSTNFLYELNLRIDKVIIENLLNNFGKSIWLDKEEKMHPATAMCGSGPAYYFLFFQYFSEFLIANGFTENEAKEIALSTCEAGLEVAKHNNNFEQLIEQVTSPNGTTHAALVEFNKEKILQKTFFKALNAASDRSKELAGD